MIHFTNWIKKTISEEKMRDLSSDGWKRMREVERKLNGGDMESEDAINTFLSERNGDYGYELGKKYKMNDYLKNLKKQ